MILEPRDITIVVKGRPTSARIPIAHHAFFMCHGVPTGANADDDFGGPGLRDSPILATRVVVLSSHRLHIMRLLP